MGRKPRRKKNQTSSRRVSWHWPAIAGVLLLIVGGAVIWNLSRNSSPVTPQVTGAPKLLVDQMLVDEGYVKFNVPVRTSYRLSNVGDQPLKIIATSVELVEGC